MSTAIEPAREAHNRLHRARVSALIRFADANHLPPAGVYRPETSFTGVRRHGLHFL